MKTVGKKMNHKTAQVLSTFCLSGVLSLGMAVDQAQADANSPALKALFDQANYWHEKSHDDLAMQSLNKVLMVDANNTQALYLMALWSQQNGNLKASAQWRARLAKADPAAPQLQALDNARQLQQVPQGQLALARQQARSGNISAALSTWRGLFNGNEPPASLAPEYYLTMAGDKSLYPQAVAGLRQLTAEHPQDNAARVALGKVLTYRDDTRRDGIDLLEEMASGNKEADSSLRQALLWLGPKAGDEHYYQTWMQRHPKDSDVLAYYRKNVGGAAKGAGFTDLNSGNLAAAQSQFEKVLQANPTDADALAGMGYVAQRQGNYQAAAQYLKRAAEQGGDASAERQKQGEDAAFYGQLAEAQQAFKQGNTAQALALSAPLAQQSGDKGMAAKLFRADVLRRTKDYAQAEQTLRDILTSSPGNAAARENLYYVLRDQNKTGEAQAMLQSLPASLQAKLQPKGGYGSPADPIRRQAQQALARGDATQAISILRQGINRLPSNPWLRLDLARILDKQGNNAAANDVMAPLYRAGSGTESLYAAALFASDQGAWQQVQTLIGRVPASARNREMRDLSQRANFNLQMATAESYLASGNQVAAANTLKALSGQVPDSPADAGKLARLMAQSGDMTSAVAVVRSSIAQGVKGNAGDYADQVAVLNQAGLRSEAQTLLSNPELQANSTPTQLAGIRNGYVINEADKLREQGNYAAAYDKLIRALQQDPQNTDLMFAMARLYQSGKMNKEAGVVYDYLMTRDTPKQDARVGAIDVALSSGDVKKARSLANGLRDTQTPDRLLLMARLSEAEGNHQQALAYLRNARGQLVGLQPGGSSTSPMIGGLVLADNPFSSTSKVQPVSNSPSLYGTSMPWQVGQVAPDAGAVVPGSIRTDLPVETAQSKTLRQVDTMIDQLDDKTGTWMQGGVEIRGRDGEAGLSKLTEAKAPLIWSSSPFGSSRFKFTVTPISLSAGTASGDAWRRLGSGGTSNSVQSLVTTMNGELSALRAMTQTQRDAFFASNPDLAAYRSFVENTTTQVSFSDLNPFTSDGLNNINALNKATALRNYLAASSYKPNVDTSTGTTSSDSQKDNGVELNLALSGDNYKADIGTTPLGTSTDLNTLVGGVQWSPKLTDYLSLIITAERRAVTDSLLSYVGVKDKLSGETWGRVTKNGGTLQLSYDNGDAGFYFGGGGYSYIGENVASNTSVNAGAGVYLRPYHDQYKQLQTGLSVSWMNFSKNLSYYSFGQGGYFSPQNYVSVALPVDFSQQFDTWKLNLGGSVGYQSYTQDSSDYYPTRSDWQSFLNEAAQYGFTKESRYSGSSKNGIGYNIHAGLDYNINNDMSVGGRVGYDTFGSYNESTAQVWFRYMLGER